MGGHAHTHAHTRHTHSKALVKVGGSRNALADDDLAVHARVGHAVVEGQVLFKHPINSLTYNTDMYVYTYSYKIKKNFHLKTT